MTVNDRNDSHSKWKIKWAPKKYCTLGQGVISAARKVLKLVLLPKFNPQQSSVIVPYYL
jgi:hypothetical protein